MTGNVREFNEPGLMNFIRTLVDDASLDEAAHTLACKVLDRGLSALSSTERATLETEVVEPYCGDCERCGMTPAWEQVLQVYDTGLCCSCFEKLAGIDDLGVRPDWMPLVSLPDEDELLPLPADAINMR